MIDVELFLRASPPGAAHPHPDLFPGSETLASDGIGASAKPGHQTTPAKHNMTSTVEACTMRKDEKGTFFPINKTAKAGRKTSKDFFPVVFRCFGCKSALVSPLGCKRWIGESMEKQRLSWSLSVTDVKKCDGFQITSVVKMNDYCVWCLASIWCL